MAVVFDEVEANFESVDAPTMKEENGGARESSGGTPEQLKRLMKDQRRRAERLEAD